MMKVISLFSLARGVAFESESDLREKGAYKTPDMLLQVPMAVKGPSNEVGCCIHGGDGCARGLSAGRSLSVVARPLTVSSSWACVSEAA